MWFGQSLRNEREQRGFSIEAVAEGTKVSVRQLRALEDGNDPELPGGVFRRGFVQSYVRFLDLDEDEWMQRFAASQELVEPDWTEFAQAVSRNRVPSAGAMQRRWWGVLLLLILLTAVGLAAWFFVVKPRVGHTVPVPPASSQIR